MLKNSKPVAAFCSVALVSGVASNLVSANENKSSNRKRQNDENNNDKRNKNLTFKEIKDRVLQNKKQTLIIAGAALGTAETAHAIYKINSVKDTKGLNVLFIGKPGAGKETNSRTLMDHYDFVHCSTGDVIRKEIAKGNITKEEQELMKQGKLLSDERVINLVKNFEKDQSKGIIWDGFPRNMNQAKSLNADLVIYLNVPDEYCNYKIPTRMSCTHCSAEFDSVYKRSKKVNVCDYCGHTLTKRVDDNLETLKERLKSFKEDTLPVIDYYKEKGILVEVKSNDNPIAVWGKIESKLKENGKLKEYEDNFYSKSWRKFKNFFVSLCS